MKKILLLCALTTILCSCATPYQKLTFSGGYTDKKIQDNVFRVTFKGNAVTKPEQVADFALLRSAEIAIANGYNYFVIADGGVRTDNTTYTTPLRAYTTGSQNTYGTANLYGNTGTVSGTGNYSSQTEFSGGETYNISEPTAGYSIVCFVDVPENASALVYDAKQVIDNLRATYKIKPKAPQRGSAPQTLNDQTNT